MPIRTASLTHQIQKNGARLHLAMVTRTHSQGADQPASEAEQALLEERGSLKAAKAALQAQPKAPKPQPAWMTRETKAPAAPKAAKVAKEPKVAKAAAKGNKPTRAEKLTKKAENLDAVDRVRGQQPPGAKWRGQSHRKARQRRLGQLAPGAHITAPSDQGTNSFWP